MKTYDLRFCALSDLTERIKIYYNCKIILTLWQYNNLPPSILQLCSFRNISIDVIDSFITSSSGETYVEKRTEKEPLGRFWITEGYENLPTNVFFNDKKKATTLMFDDKATVVKCGKDDEYSRRIGFLEAYFQATCGLSKTQAKKYLDKIVKDKVVKDKEVKDEVKKK